MVAYFRLVVNPLDEEALRRVINYPKRAIGNTTVDKISAQAKAMEEMANKAKDIRKQFNAAEAQLTAQYESVMKAGSKALLMKESQLPRNL